MRVFLVILLSSVLASCASVGHFESVLQQHIGSSENDLVSAYGPPSSVYRLDDGSKMLTYGSETDKILYRKWCIVTWTLDSSGTVTNWRHEGKTCKSKPSSKRKKNAILASEDN